jgi:hypothetical protein
VPVLQRAIVPFASNLRKGAGFPTAVKNRSFCGIHPFILPFAQLSRDPTPKLPSSNSRRWKAVKIEVLDSPHPPVDDCSCRCNFPTR